MDGAKLDEIGYWSEVKLEIVRKYSQAYSTIMSKQAGIRRHIYVDGFAGAGVHISKKTRGFVLGSPLNALHITPPFTEFHLIDMDGGRAAGLRELVGDRPEVHVYEADCNQVLVDTVFPRARWSDRHRALCLLDPYGLHLDWRVIAAAGAMKSVEVFLNFPVMDMNMNVLWGDRSKVRESQKRRMDAFWGGSNWQEAAYRRTQGLFEEMEERAAIHAVARAYRDRLRDEAGFEFVPEPMPMRNTRGGIVYFLFFASPNRTGARIVAEIFEKYRSRS